MNLQAQNLTTSRYDGRILYNRPDVTKVDVTKDESANASSNPSVWQPEQDGGETSERLKSVALKLSDLSDTRLSPNGKFTSANGPFQFVTTPTPLVRPSATLPQLISAIKPMVVETIKPLTKLPPIVNLIKPVCAGAETELADPNRTSEEQGLHSEIKGEVFVGAENNEIQVTE